MKSQLQLEAGYYIPTGSYVLRLGKVNLLESDI